MTGNFSAHSGTCILLSGGSSEVVASVVKLAINPCSGIHPAWAKAAATPTFQRIKKLCNGK